MGYVDDLPDLPPYVVSVKWVLEGVFMPIIGIIGIIGKQSLK